MEIQRTIQGVKANSKRYAPARIEIEPPNTNTAYYEARITGLFLPWLVNDVPDGRWQTLQKKLEIIVKELLSKRNMGVKEYGQ